MEWHVKALAWSYIGLSSLAWFAAVTFGVSVNYLDESQVPIDIAGTGLSMMFFATVFFAPPVAGAIGLLRGASWARGWMLLISVLSLAMFALVLPALLGAYGLWVLTSPDVRSMFAERGSGGGDESNFPPSR